jgi:PleD family two-component response regulator
MRVRKRVSQLEVQDPRNGKLIEVSATLAVASYPKHGNVPQALLEAVGDALIVAKERGGNTTVVAGR